MSVRDLIPWSRNDGTTAPAMFRDEDRNPFLSLHREMNRLFDDIFRSFDRTVPGYGTLSSPIPGWPRIEISETDKEIKVTADIPGLEEKDVELLLEGDVLSIRGEKRSETEDKERQFSERFYGRFERRIPLGVEVEVEQDKVEARFRNGVLSVTLPKSAKARSQVKRIAVAT